MGGGRLGHGEAIYRLNRVDYAERLSVPLRWWAQGTMLIATFWLAILAAVPPAQEYIAWTATALALGLMAAGFISYGSARVAVVEGELHAGRARIPLAHVGAVTALDAEGMRRQAGMEADARAHLVLRPYLKRGVRVEINDATDPTPYWLVSSRKPERVAAAVESARGNR